MIKILVVFFIIFSSNLFSKINYPLNLAKDAPFFADASATMSLEQVRKSSFKIHKKNSIGFRPSKNRYWFKLNLPKNRTKDLYLAVSSPIIDNVNLYKEDDGKWSVEKNGDHISWSKKKIKYKYPVFLIPKTSGDTVYLSLLNIATMGTTLFLHDELSFSENKKYELAFDVFFYGITVTMFFYNLFIFFSSREKKYAFYCLYLFITVISTFVGITGEFNSVFRPEMLFFRNRFNIFCIGFQGSISNLLYRKFLNTEEKQPLLNKVITWHIYIYIIVGLFCLSPDLYKISARFLPILIFVSTLTLVINGFVGFGRGFASKWSVFRETKFFIPAYGFYLCGVIVFALSQYGIIGSTFFTLRGLQLGTLMEVILISLALADVINFLRIRDKQKSEELADLNKNLEKKVEERTEELSASLGETRSLLNNMKQSVFSVNKEGTIIPPVSNYSEEIFGQKLDGENVFDTLFEGMDKNSEDFSRLRFALDICVGEDSFQYDITDKDVFPNKYKMVNGSGDYQSLKIGYAPIINKSDIVEKLMLVVEDVTEIEKLEKESKEKEAKVAVKIKKLQEVVSNDKKSIKFFFEEAFLNITLGKDSLEKNDLNSLFRAAHTLKGMGRIYGLNGFSQELHIIENKIDEYRENPPEEFPKEEMEDVLKKIQLSLDSYMGVSKEIFGDDVFGKTSDSEQSFIEIPKEVFQGCVDELKVIFNNKEIPELGRIIEKLITEDFKLTLSGLQKTVLGISSSLLKDIELQIEGDDIYFENKTASSLKDAIMHILQNSCDHGITKSGEIKIILKELENETKITIIDNGKGIDPDLILNKAIEKGFTKREASQNFTKKEKLELILLPGFSTKETATEYSGRGVGMDVVKTNLNGLGGTLEIESTLGEGTQFSILVPKKV